MGIVSPWFVRSEQSGKTLALAKLVNSILVLGWGFGSTFVFARVLGTSEFANFVLLVALANFTIGAEFGVTNIVYDRLRRHVLKSTSDFSYAEIGALLVLMLMFLIAGTIAIAVALVSGIIPTDVPALFVGIFLLGALNMVLLLAKRVLAALNRNLAFEAIDMVRRTICLALLFGILLGLDLVASVYAQLAITIVALAVSFATAKSASGTAYAVWGNFTAGLDRIRKAYRSVIGPAMLLTAVDIAGYNLPFILIAALTEEIRPLLLYDFLYKLLRTTGIFCRIGAEATLPRITRAAHSSNSSAMLKPLLKGYFFGLAIALAVAVLLSLAGPMIVTLLYGGKWTVTAPELAWIILAVLTLPFAGTSMYINGAFARFTILLKPAIFLLAAAIAIPAAISLMFGNHWGNLFLPLFTIAYAIMCLMHAASIVRFVREVQVGTV